MKIQAGKETFGAYLRAITKEKDLDESELLEALEDAIAAAVKKQYRLSEPVKAEIDLDKGEIRAYIAKKVVEEVEDPLSEYSLEEAKEHDPNAQIGSEVRIPISTEGLGRIAAQLAKHVLMQRIREAERKKVYDEFSKRIGEIVTGTLRRIEQRGDMILDLGRTEAVLPRKEQVKTEKYSIGDRIKAVIIDVKRDTSGPQVVLSRTDARLLKKLFEKEAPEIYDGTVVIKNAVRVPGERAKIAVYSRDRDVDPVGACVGMRGQRVQAVMRELKGEKIDIIEYSDDIITFARDALAPARITRISVTQEGDKPKLDVIVEDDQLSLAIGKKGQNVKLASELIGCEIDIKSESQVKEEVASALEMLFQMEEKSEESSSVGIEQAPIADDDLVTTLKEAGIYTAQDVVENEEKIYQLIEGGKSKSLVEWAKEIVSESQETTTLDTDFLEALKEQMFGDDSELEEDN